MDLLLAKKGVLDYTLKRKKWILLLAALGVSSYGAYKVYNLPSVVEKRKRLSGVLGALVSMAEILSHSAESVGVISKDFSEFIKSGSDQVPPSFGQISKLATSSELSDSVVCLTQGLTTGILRGYQSSSGIEYDVGEKQDSSCFLDKVFDKLSSPAGSGLVSAVIGSFARNLIMGIFQGGQSTAGLYPNLEADDSFSRLIGVVCTDKGKDLIGDCIQLFVSTGVAVYLEKTMHINTFDELFAGLTNPKHEKEVKEMLVSVCNGAVDTLVKTSHKVLTSPEYSTPTSTLDSLCSTDELLDDVEFSSMSKEKGSLEEVGNDDGWIGKVSSTLAMPRNRNLVLDLAGRVSSETIRSFLEFLVDKIHNAISRCVNVLHEVVDTSADVVRHIRDQYSYITTLCLSLYLQMFETTWMLSIV